MYQTYQETTQGRMGEPPRVITKKDLLYLQDALSWELLASKKAHHFAGECEDTHIKQCLEDLATKHEQHYQLLLKHLQPQSQNQNINQYSQMRS